MSNTSRFIFRTIIAVFFASFFFSLVDFAKREKILARLSPNLIAFEEPTELVKMYKKYLEGTMDEILEKLRPFNGSCINGKHPQNMTAKEQLIEFIQGPCSPVVLVPGLFGSKLSLSIDCEKLRTSHPDIFKTCGWKSCSRWHFWESRPDDHYIVWITEFWSDVNFIFHESATCWGQLLRLEYDASAEDLSLKFKSPEGVKITVYGGNEYTEELGACGLNSVSNLLHPVSVGMTRGYIQLIEKLVSMGYQKGLTLYATPYDWRLSTLTSKVHVSINETLTQVYNLTGKPAVLISHSLGALGVLYYLNSLPALEKEKYVQTFVSVVGTLTGTPLATNFAIGGDEDFVWQNFGIHFPAQKNLMGAQLSIIDLQPKDVLERFANEKWLQEWKVRQELEDKYDVLTPEGRAAWEKIIEGDYPYKWFPHPLINCSNNTIDRLNPCGFYSYNWSAEPIVEIQGKVFTASSTDLKKIFREYVTLMNQSYIDDFFEISLKSDAHLLKNPEVPVVIIYGGYIMTPKSFIWNYDPTEKTRKDEFAFPDKTNYTYGDGTVPVAFSLLPGLKWAWEYDHKEEANLPHAKPVKMVEYCTTYNNKGTIYDQLDEDKPYRVLKNEYISLQCECMNHPLRYVSQLLGKCHHAEAIGDDYVTELISNIVHTNRRIKNLTYVGANLLNDTGIELVIKKCPPLNPGSTTYSELIAEGLVKLQNHS